jgi:Flp pilus assembly protein TadD
VRLEGGHSFRGNAVDLLPNAAAKQIHEMRDKWAGANTSFQRAVALEPANPENVEFAAWSAATLGHFDEALRLDRQAIDLDPLNADGWGHLAETEFLWGS